VEVISRFSATACSMATSFVNWSKKPFHDERFSGRLGEPVTLDIKKLAHRTTSSPKGMSNAQHTRGDG
jgi:hypothetical protein